MSSVKILEKSEGPIGNRMTDDSPKSGQCKIVERKRSNGLCSTQHKMLMQLVRMGSFQSPNPRIPMIELEENEMCKMQLKEISTIDQMIKFCKCQLSAEEPMIPRKFINKSQNIDYIDTISVMQWNVLSQALGLYYDKFETCTHEEMQWTKRKWKIVLEILQYNPIDIICLQEVDHFEFLMEILAKLGYDGKFVPKPDSPCYYITNNSGPDGCAIFWKTNKLSLISSSERILQVYQCKSNQVALYCKFKWKSTGFEFGVATTHLKARNGTILSALRNEQGKDLLNFLSNESKNLSIILTGDFNAEPNESVYGTLKKKLSSAYSDGLRREPSFTNWTKREGEKESKKTLDYIFYNPSIFEVVALLLSESSKLNTPIPNQKYPSDHLSLIARFKIRPTALK